MVEHWSTCDSVEYWCKNQMYLILVGLKRHLLLFMSVLSCRSVEICVVLYCKKINIFSVALCLIPNLIIANFCMPNREVPKETSNAKASRFYFLLGILPSR